MGLNGTRTQVGCGAGAVLNMESSQTVHKQAGNSRVGLLISQPVEQWIDGAAGQWLTAYWLDVVRLSGSISAIDAENKRRCDLLCVCVCVFRLSVF